MGDIYLEPFVDAFGVIFVATGENAKGLTSFEFAHANDASALATFFDLARKSIRRQLIDLRTRQSSRFGFTQAFGWKNIQILFIIILKPVNKKKNTDRKFTKKII